MLCEWFFSANGFPTLGPRKAANSRSANERKTGFVTPGEGPAQHLLCQKTDFSFLKIVIADRGHAARSDDRVNDFRWGVR
jgi:hypothetical protein